MSRQSTHPIDSVRCRKGCWVVATLLFNDICLSALLQLRKQVIVTTVITVTVVTTVATVNYVTSLFFYSCHFSHFFTNIPTVTSVTKVRRMTNMNTITSVTCFSQWQYLMFIATYFTSFCTVNGRRNKRRHFLKAIKKKHLCSLVIDGKMLQFMLILIYYTLYQSTNFY